MVDNDENNNDNNDNNKNNNNTQNSDDDDDDDDKIRPAMIMITHKNMIMKLRVHEIYA